MFNGQPCPQNPVATPGTVAINAVAANTTVLDTVACPGARVGDFVVVRPNGVPELGMMFGAARVSAANVVEVPIMNTTAAALPAAAQTYDVMCLPSS